MIQNFELRKNVMIWVNILLFSVLYIVFDGLLIFKFGGNF